MRIPEPFFPFINLVMKMLLRSPLHGLMSGSLMVVCFTGKKTGRAHATPVRYLRQEDGALFCLTTRETRWWPNFRQPSPVELQLGGRRVAATAQALLDNEAPLEPMLRQMLSCFPGDAAYQGITLDPDGAIPEQQLGDAVRKGVAVRFTLSAQPCRRPEP